MTFDLKKLDEVIADIEGQGWEEILDVKDASAVVESVAAKKERGAVPALPPDEIPDKLPEVGNYGELAAHATVPAKRVVELHKGEPDRLTTRRPRYDRGFQSFQKIIQTNDGSFIEACKMQPRDSKWFALALMIVHPSWARYSLAAKCRKLSISLREIKEFYVESQKMFGEVVMAERLPDIMERAADEAAGFLVICGRCSGSGFEPLPPPKSEDEEQTQIQCKQCDGSGRVMTSANADARDAVLQMSGLISKSKGVNVNTNINLQQNTTIEDTSSDIGRILEVRPE